MRLLVYTMFITNNCENLVKNQKISKYYENDCNLKAVIDQIDIDKLKAVSSDLSSRSNVVVIL